MLKRMAMCGIVAGFLIGAGTPAWACFTSFDQCMHEAAVIDSWYYRWLKGLDCELDFIDCVGEKLNPFLD